MRRVLLLLLWSAGAVAESPFTRMWRAIGGGAPDTSTGVVGCVIQDRDFTKSPRVEVKAWNVPCILDAELTAAQLANVKDPAKLLNARRARAIKPTPAVWITPGGGEYGLNPSHLVDAETAQRIYARLIDWGCEGSLVEMDVSSPVVKLDWRGETRRWLKVGSIDVGTVALRIRSDIIERATAETRVSIGRGECR